jgi:hypothetical protein
MKRILLLILMCLPLALAACDNAPNWQEFAPKDGRFSILMPGTPRDATQTQSGVVAPTFSSILGGEAFTVSYFDAPPAPTSQEEIDATIDGIRDVILIQAGAKLLEEEVATLQNFPGRKFKIKPESGAAFLKYQVFLVNERVYMLFYQSPKDDIPPDNADKFFNSFKLTPQ